MGIFDKLKYGNTFGNTVSIRDTVVKQYPKEVKQVEKPIVEKQVEEPIVEKQVEEPIVEKPKPQRKSTPPSNTEEII